MEMLKQQHAELDRQIDEELQKKREQEEQEEAED